ncbi:hypothetical protein GGR54DRAFT_625398 [Hypoxylon sp. NC1633]|nr:hypothetical protein GGR54DRAFT_625398 [Hypoxylon sp. NC1633]
MSAPSLDVPSTCHIYIADQTHSQLTCFSPCGQVVRHVHHYAQVSWFDSSVRRIASASTAEGSWCIYDHDHMSLISRHCISISFYKNNTNYFNMPSDPQSLVRDKNMTIPDSQQSTLLTDDESNIASNHVRDKNMVIPDSQQSTELSQDESNIASDPVRDKNMVIPDSQQSTQLSQDGSSQPNLVDGLPYSQQSTQLSQDGSSQPNLVDGLPYSQQSTNLNQDGSSEDQPNLVQGHQSIREDTVIPDSQPSPPHLNLEGPQSIREDMVVPNSMANTEDDILSWESPEEDLPDSILTEDQENVSPSDSSDQDLYIPDSTDEDDD